jgi:hypothetical protein
VVIVSVVVRVIVVVVAVIWMVVVIWMIIVMIGMVAIRVVIVILDRTNERSLPDDGGRRVGPRSISACLICPGEEARYY